MQKQKWDSPKTNDLIRTILTLKNEEEARDFFRDLLTEGELIEFGKRWQAAQMLAEKEPYLEGCLSIPKIYGPVLRHQSIKIKFSIINYQLSITEKTSVFSGFPARVIQHELDHLDGILFTDRSIQQELPIYEEQRGKLVEIKLI